MSKGIGGSKGVVRTGKKDGEQAVARVVESAAVAPSAGEAIGADLTNLALNPEAEAGKLEIDPQFGERKPKNSK